MLLAQIFLAFSYYTIVYSKSVNQSDQIKAELEEYIKKKKLEINPRYRLRYHVTPPVGWMNDPNGFSYSMGEYHLFYQFYPYDSVWGSMHWGHSTSTDLINWKDLPTALIPEREQCFSGSAVVDEDLFILMYTGHEITNSSPYYRQTQYLAFSRDRVNFDKFEGNPVISSAPDGSADFRDPKVWRHEDYWYVIIGSKTIDQRGRVLLYRSRDMKNWKFLSVVGESKGDLGYMWECPDFFELNGKHILLISPQGIQPQGDRYKNTYQTGYFIGSFDYDNFEFIPEVGFQEMDYGHDYYAAQTTEVNGKRYVIAWLGMWEVPHPEDVDGWAGAMTIVRELTLVGNRIIMKPVQDMVSLRERKLFDGTFQMKQQIEFNKTGEIIVEGDLSQKIELLLEGRNGGGKMWLRWRPEVRKVIVDRGFGDVRQVEWSPIGSKSWKIFLDASSMEMFCGEGEAVFSSRVYPNGGWKISNLSSQSLNFTLYQLKRSVPI